MNQQKDMGILQEVGWLLLDMGRLAAAVVMGSLRLMFFGAHEDVFCPGPGLGISCHRPFDHSREHGRCASCHLISKDRELQYLMLML